MQDSSDPSHAGHVAWRRDRYQVTQSNDVDILRDLATDEVRVVSIRRGMRELGLGSFTPRVDSPRLSLTDGFTA